MKNEMSFKLNAGLTRLMSYAYIQDFGVNFP